MLYHFRKLKLFYSHFCRNNSKLFKESKRYNNSSFCNGKIVIPVNVFNLLFSTYNYTFLVERSFNYVISIMRIHHHLVFRYRVNVFFETRLFKYR